MAGIGLKLTDYEKRIRHKESVRKSYQKHKIKIQENMKQYYRDNPDIYLKKMENDRLRRKTIDVGGYLWQAAKQRSKKKGLQFELTQQHVTNEFNRGTCAVTGIPFVTPQNGRSNWSPSLDRKDQNLGYTDDNVQMVCWMYNSAKGQGTHNDVLRMAQALLNR